MEIEEIYTYIFYRISNSMLYTQLFKINIYYLCMMGINNLKNCYNVNDNRKKNDSHLLE